MIVRTDGEGQIVVEHIENRTLFHLTESKPYKKALVTGQTIHVGDSYIPYFEFYENALTYSTTVHDGSVVHVPAVNFLKQVSNGVINCPNLPVVAAEVAQHYIMLCRELIMEEIRVAEFQALPPSRQRCLYLCESLDEAVRWKPLIGQDSAICELRCTGTIHRADANLLLEDSEPLSVTRDRARKYWQGEQTDNPHREILFVGDVEVIAVGVSAVNQNQPVAATPAQ